MATLVHVPHVHVMTRFRAQAAWRALALLACSALTWVLPRSAGGGMVDAPSRWLGSALTELVPLAAVAVLLTLAVVAFWWQMRRPADMGALAWVVAGGILMMVSLALVMIVGSAAGPVYWWLGAAVAVTSMALQVLAALAGHGVATLVQRRHA